MSVRTEPFLLRAARHFALGIATLFAIYPVLLVLSVALQERPEADPNWIPFQGALSTSNFERLFESGDGLFLMQLGNSVFVALLTAVCAVLIAAPAAYALSRFEFLGKQSSLRAMLATQMFPGVAAAVPLYLLLDSMSLLDSLLGLALVYGATAIPFAIFQLRSAFDAIPIELEQAAMVDGASRSQAFFLVVLPAARPALAVTTLFGFMTAWNEFILAATFLSDESRFTLPVVLQRFVGEHHADWGAFSAGAIVVSVPVMLLFYALQKNLVAGLNAGAVKG